MSDLMQHTFRRLELEAQQYIPFFNQRRVIALRGRSDLTYKNRNQTLPFYMQPTLGGSNDLRGFRPFRFTDDNLMVFNAEYRYEIFSGLDMAFSATLGKVFHSKRDWNLTIWKAHTVSACVSMRVTPSSCGSTQASVAKVFRYG